MAESELDKSEQATPFSLRRAREKGMIARGLDLGTFSTLMAALGFAWLAGYSSVVSIARTAASTIAIAPTLGGEKGALLAAMGGLFGPAAYALILLGATVFGVVLVVDLIQVGPVFSVTPLKPDFKRLNPAQGFKRLFSIRLLIEAFKSVVKLAIYTTIAWLVIRSAMRTDILAVSDGGRLIHVMARVAFRLIMFCALAAFFFAVIDQMFVRRQFAKQMRMSRRDVRREHRDHEGDPQIRQKRRKLHAEFSKAAMSLRNVKGSDIIITNPEHFAVALRYDATRMSAPKIVAAGSGAFAARIKRVAFTYGIVIVRDPPLARALFREGRLDQEIPDKHYQSVADLYLRYRLARKGTN